MKGCWFECHTCICMYIYRNGMSYLDNTDGESKSQQGDAGHRKGVLVKMGCMNTYTHIHICNVIS